MKTTIRIPSLAPIVVGLLLAPRAHAQTPLESGADPNAWVLDATGRPIAAYRIGAGLATTATAGAGGVTVTAADGTSALLPGTTSASSVLVSRVGGSLPAPTLAPPMSVVSLTATTATASAPTRPGVRITPPGGAFEGTVRIGVEAFPSATGAGPVTLLVSVDGGLAATVGATSTSVVLIEPGTRTITATATQGAQSSSVSATFTLTGTNARQRDSDGDGVPDVVEVELGSDPLAADAARDSDGDGWSDLDERLRGSAADAATSRPVDADGDGWSDWDEELRGTDPDDAASTPVATDLDAVELLVSASLWSDEARATPATGSWVVDVSDASWRLLASIEGGPAVGPLRVPGDAHLVVAATESIVGQEVMKALVLGTPDASPAIIGAIVRAGGFAYADADAWLALYEAALADYVVRDHEVDLDPWTGFAVALAEAAVAWAGGVDFGAPVLLGEYHGAIAPEALAEVAGRFADLVTLATSDAIVSGDAFDLADFQIVMQAPPDGDATTSWAMAERLQRATPDDIAWPARYLARLVAYGGLGRVEGFAPFDGSDAYDPWLPDGDADRDDVANVDELVGGPGAATDPLWPDSDDDGVGDLADPCPRDASDGCVEDAPFALDGDGDGVIDALDNCFGAANPLQTDTNGDGIGDACEAPARIATPVGHVELLAPGAIDFTTIRSAAAVGTVTYRWKANGVELSTAATLRLALPGTVDPGLVDVRLYAADGDSAEVEVDRRFVRVLVDDGPVPCLALDCDDRDACTRDSCDLALGCRHAPIAGCLGCEDDVDCDDNEGCTSESCVDGACVRADLDGQGCDDANLCTVGDACLGGSCKPGGPAICDDLDPCTIDSCAAATGCANDPDPSPDPILCPECDDDGDCGAGVCLGGACCEATAFADGVTRPWTPGDADPVLCLAAGTEIDVIGTSTSSNSVTIRIRDPQGTQLASTVGSFTSNRTELEAAPVSGPYTVDLTSAGALNYTVRQSFDVATALPGFGVKTRLTTATIGAEAHFTFEGEAGQVVSILGEMATPSGCPDYQLRDPSGALHVAENTCGDWQFLEPTTLDATGTWTVRVDPGTSLVGDIDVTVWLVPPQRVVPITLDGSAHVEVFDTPGQTVAWEFTGAAGQRVSFVSNDPQCADHYVVGPTGTIYSGASCENIFSDAVTLPVAGAYRWVVDPTGAARPTETVYGYDVPPDPVVAATIGGPAVAIDIVQRGQNGSFTFAAVAGDVIAATFTQPASITSARYILTSPTGVELVNVNSGNAPFLDRRTLTESGTYVVSVNPASTSMGTIGMRLYAVPPDVTGTLVVGAAGVPLAVTTPGQNLAPTFVGVAGQSVKIVSSVSGTATYTVLTSAGAQVFASGSRTSGYTSAYFVLPADDTYTLAVNPSGSGTPTFTLAIAL